jgi:Xaa-Pro dipeptidase
MDETRLQRLQALLQRYELPAWLLCDFRHSNPIAYQVLGLDPTLHCTRRWAVLIPAQGQPEKLLHRVEPHVLQDVPARERLYATYGEWQRVLHEWVQRYRVWRWSTPLWANCPPSRLWTAAQWSCCASSGRSCIHRQTWCRSFWRSIRSSSCASLRRRRSSFGCWSGRAFAWIGEQLRRGESPQEYAVQQLLLQRLRQQGLVTDHPPIVARTERAANPHYAPTAQDTAPIRLGDLVLIDIWAKPNAPDALYADITWMAYAGEIAPDRFAEPFAKLCAARDAAIELITSAVARREPIAGYQVDRHVRQLLAAAGYAKEFLHRTGHSLGTEVHGAGANLDDYETHDTRRLLPGTAVTIEPGIYRAGEFGMRTEVDLLLWHDCAEVHPQPLQQRLIPLLAEHWQ